MSEEAETPFGLLLYEELRTRGELQVLTEHLDYSGLQEFKASDRAAVSKVFHGSDYATVQLVKRGTPSEIAAHISMTRRTVSTAILIAGILLT